MMVEISSSSQGEKKYVDVEAGLARVRGNKIIFERMLKLFLDSPEFAAFEESLSEGDHARSANVIHGIKGMTGNLSMKPLSELSAQLNEQLKQGAPDEQTLADYRDAYEKTRAYVEAIMAGN